MAPLKQTGRFHQTTHRPLSSLLFALFETCPVRLAYAETSGSMANPVGEDSWLAYVEEAARTATDIEQRVNIVELYKRAVGAEPGSLRLWLAYCEYFWNLWSDSHSNDSGWSEDERAIGEELFSLDAARELWQLAYDAVKYRINDSQQLWDRWMTLEIDLLAKHGKTSDKVKRITDMYRQRLATPHLSWDATSQAFSSFLSQHDQAEWEQAMELVTSGAQEIKKAIEARDPFELKLAQAARAGDVEAQKTIMRDSLDWEMRQIKRKGVNLDLALGLCSGLYDRALSGLFATDQDVWYDYIVFLSSSTSEPYNSIDQSYDALKRAVQHCPWSGRLWSRYILCAERAGLSFTDLRTIKDAAISPESQLCVNGMENMLEMYAAWCGYVRRVAMGGQVAEEVEGAAEAEIKAALKDVAATGKRLYGKEFQGDPKFRLERIYVQYLTEREGDIVEARAQWKKLEKSRLHADSYEFWMAFYSWEMQVFSLTRSIEDIGSGAVPSDATAVLHMAATRRSIDWPEKVLDAYMQHCNDHEMPDAVQQAADVVHSTMKAVRYRRQREEQEKAAAFSAYYGSQAQEQAASIAGAAAAASPSGGKRKRIVGEVTQEDDAENASKRQRNGSVDSGGQPPKRDRENATILVTNLPGDATQTKLRQYFKDYGHINNVTAFVKDEEKQSTTALIEFKSADEAQSALLRDAKYFGESQITVQPGYDLTVYVANFPPTADEAYIRNLFKDCGAILSLRWPSLKVNTHRRFCYISFADRQGSAKAVAKEGKVLDGKYSLLANYSDPGRKKNREGAMAEAREVHVSNLDRSLTEEDIRDVFGKFGTVMRVNIPLNMAGKSRGFAFLDFETAEQAASAVEGLNNTKLRSQILQVQISKENKVKMSAKSLTTASEAGADSLHDGEGDHNMHDEHHRSASPTVASSEIAARTIALMGLPDTVNDARVRALVEPLGAITKLVHQPGHGGAIIEFADAATAGKAALQLDGREYEGSKLRTGPPDELKHAKAEKAVAPGNSKSKQSLMPPPPVTRRPVLGKGGQKRGLGFVPKKAGTALSNEAGAKSDSIDANTGGAAKSNADFKAMFLKGKTD